jgi:hypothetical protein
MKWKFLSFHRRFYWQKDLSIIINVDLYYNLIYKINHKSTLRLNDILTKEKIDNYLKIIKKK